MFCTHGYGGASVAVLVRAAGLSKASLYHHFPGGKEARLEVGMLAPLAGESPLPERVDAMMAAVEEHHGGGCEPGIFGQFSQVGADHPFAAPVAAFYGRWIASLADALSENGVESEEAVCRAAVVVMVVEGALLLSRVLADPGPLHRVRRHLPSTIAEGG